MQPQAPQSNNNSYQSAPTPLAYVPTTRSEVLRVVIAGLVAGLLIPLISILIANYVISPIFCTASQNFSVCASGGVIANHAAAIIVGIAAFFVLTRWAVYRALLLVIAVTIAMWGLKKYADPLTAGNLLEYSLFSMLLYGLSYSTFYWLLRLRNFAVSAVLTVVVVVAVYWAMVAW